MRLYALLCYFLCFYDLRRSQMRLEFFLFLFGFFFVIGIVPGYALPHVR